MNAKTQYIVMCGQIVGGGERPFEAVFSHNGECFDDRSSAISAGLKQRGSDDFNIGVLQNGKLVSLDWMNEPVDTDPEVLREVAKFISGDRR